MSKVQVQEAAVDLRQVVKLIDGLWILDHVRSQINQFLQMSLADVLYFICQLQVNTIEVSRKQFPGQDPEAFALGECVVIVEFFKAVGLINVNRHVRAVELGCII